MPSSTTEVRKHVIIVGLGEVLFDVFEDGTETLGGAPLNVAVHVHQLASAVELGKGVVVSRIGADVHGTQILDSLRNLGMPTRYIQSDSHHPTGTVSVFMLDGEPGYQIASDVAWDFLEHEANLDELAASCDAVCFGSLAQRGLVSQGTIRCFLQKASRALRLYDMNLRRNTLTHEAGYSADVIEESCHLATTMKLNEIELAELCQLYGIACSTGSREEMIRMRIEGVLRRFPISAIILTRGAGGTRLFTHGREFRGHVPPASLTNVYPVGAGDACSAGFLLGSVLGWDPDDTVDLANQMGAWVASQLSATPALPDSILQFVRETMHSHSVL